MTNIEVTLAERDKRYGAFKGHAKITWDLKKAIALAPRYSTLTDSQKEALDMIAHKIGRILNGDPNWPDSWHDIAGYAKLVEDEINANVKFERASANPPIALKFT